MADIATLWRGVERRFCEREGIPARRRPRTLQPHLVLGAVVFASLLLVALLAPALATHPPDALRISDRLQPPSSRHLFGTDELGRDLFSRVVFGTRIALQTSLTAVLMAGLPGIILGLIAGYRRGWVDYVLSRLMDATLSLPSILLAVVLVARLGPSLETTVLALGIAGIPSYFRLVRGSTMASCQTLYVEAAHAVGVPAPRILFRHILPNVLSPIIVLTSLRMGTVLLAVSGLSFIGLGAQPPSPEWGALLSAGRSYLDTAWWLAFFPGAAIALTVFGFNLLGDGLQAFLAPNPQNHRGEFTR